MQSNPEITNCAERNDREGVLRCLENKQPIDETRKDGRSALLLACLNGHFDIVKLLVEHNANIFLKNNKGSNAILHAAYKNHYEIISYLVAKGVNANECDIQGRNALHMACSHGANETILFLLNNNVIKDINAKTNDKKDALLCSIDGDCSASSVLELLANGANVLTQTSEGHNVLMECARQGRTKLFHILYRYSNINVNIKDANDNCCIHFACENGNIHILRSLLHRGAFVRVRNKKGKYPVDIARENKHDTCASMLEAICSPPADPIIENVLLVGGEQGGAAAVVWKNPRPFNYYPKITAIEVQLKQQRLFDQWKTVGTVQMSDSVFKEKPSTTKLSFLNGELTDCESESELDERNEVEMSCLSISNRETTMEMRQELDNQEHMLPRYYILSDLVDSTRYAVRVRLANKYGWGTYSSSFNFCIHDLIAEFKIQDFKPICIARSSLLNQNEPVKKAPESNTNSLSINESVINGLTEALENQRNIKAASVNATEILTRALSEGVGYLNKLLSENINLSTIRNASGMSLLHAASASTSPHAMDLIYEIVNRNLLSVNDRSKNGSIPLHFAIYNSNFEAAVFLIENQSDLTAKDSNGVSPFLLAVERGNLQLCTYIAEKVSREHLYVVDKNGRNALMKAVNASHLHIADYLIESLSFDPFEKLPEPYGWNLLFFAVNTKSDTVVKYCLEKGISPLEESTDGTTAIEYSHEKGTDQIDTLLERYARVPETVEDVQIQAMFNQAILTIPLPVLREKHPLFEIRKVEVSYKKNVMLSTSLTESVSVVADSKEVTIHLHNLAPETQYKCKVRCFNQNGPSKWKSGFEFATSAEELIMVPEPAQESDVYSLISTAMRNVEMDDREKSSKEEEVIQWIDAMAMDKLETASEDQLRNARDSFNLPCLHHLLLTAGAHSRQNVFVCLEMLLQKQCDLNEAVDALGLTRLTPVDCACMVCNGQFIPLLESRGAKLNSTQVLNVPSSVFYSLLCLSPAALERVLESTSQTLQQINKSQPLLPLLAMIHKFAGVEAIADYLLREGMDVHQTNSEGNTALHVSVIHNNLLLLAHLLQKGIKTELLNLQGKTAYQLAEQSGNGPALALFMNTYRTPWPVQRITLLSYTSTTLLLHWSPPHMPAEIPAVDLYEVEVTNTNTHTTLRLPAVKTLYCFLDLPACHHIWSIARVRCHNTNGWSEWSSYGSFCPLHTSIAEDDYLTWMVCHDCEDCFAALKESDCFSLEDLAECTVEQIMELNVPLMLKEKLIRILPMAVEDVKNDCECLAKSSVSHFSWYK